MKRFWISWYQTTEDYRPIHYPIPIKWWWSWWRGSDEEAALCAVVDAKTEKEAKKKIREHWPEAKEWRFCDEVDHGWMPNSGRFPVSKSKSPEAK